MVGKYNSKTKRYENVNGNPITRFTEPNGFTPEDVEELRKIKKIEAEGGTYLERYARELGVSQSDLWRNILANNSIDRVMRIDNYSDFKMLKQTLVEENNPIKKIFDTVASYVKW